MSTVLIGTAPDQVPTNSLLGNLAFQDSKSLILDAQTSISTVSSALPTVKPSLNLDFTANSTLDSRISFSRTTSATYYDGVTTAVSEQNLLTYSQDFSKADWLGLAYTVVPNTAMAPDGTITAHSLYDTAVGGIHYVYNSLSVPQNSTMTYSVYAKANTLNYITIGINDFGVGTSYAAAVFNLSTGVLSTSGASGTGYSILSTSITSVANNWYRCSITCTVGTGAAVKSSIGTNKTGIISAGSGGFEGYTGNVSGIYIWGAQLEQRSSATSYTPTTNQPITNYIPVLKTAATNQPRLDYDPVTRQPKGLLIEEQRTNLSSYSGNITVANGYATDAIATLVQNVTIAPDGTQSASQLQYITNSYFYKNITTTVSVVYTWSIYAKLGTGGNGQITISQTNGGATFNLSTGTIVSGTGTITPVGNGWYRLSQPMAAIGTTTTCSAVMVGTFSAGQGHFFWGAQLEAGATATSYIPTTTAQVTRNADNAYISDANFSSWYNQGQGTFLTEFQGGLDSTQNGYGRVLGYGISGSTSAATFISTNGSSNSIGSFNASTSLSIGVSNYYWTNPGKVSFTYNGINTSVSAKGFYNSYAALSSPVAIPWTVSKIRFGGNSGNDTNMLNGHIKKVSYYPIAQSQAAMIGLTQ